MTNLAPEFKPPWALACWYDREAIFLELPVKGGPPYITRLPFNEQGLTKALRIMKELWSATEAKPTNGHAKHEMVDRKANVRLTNKGLRGGTKHKYTEAQHEAAKAVLRKMGLI